ncbi:hypothetical protein B0H21DRAFT_844599 [Amylocystis lapponica]|nr:hypothetical protein B0H21DRAFT_844599 [Amylocystis lapponica]
MACATGNITRLLLLLKDHPDYAEHLSLTKLHQFLSAASRLKDVMILEQPFLHPPSVPVRSLSSGIQSILSSEACIPRGLVNDCWDAFKEIVWSYKEPRPLNSNSDPAKLMGYTLRTLFPPSHTCLSMNCSKARALKKVDIWDVVLFTLVFGAVPAKKYHLYCPTCLTSYQYNFHVNNGLHTYYGGVLDTLQVGKHHFVERVVLEMFIHLMLTAWASAMNCANTYNESLGRRSKLDSNRFDHDDSTAFVPYLHTEHVWDGFWAHYCRKCVHIFLWADEETLDYISAVVMDGISIGHPTCAHHSCPLPLASNHDRYCVQHDDKHLVCTIKDCQNPVLDGHLACDDPVHQWLETQYNTRKSAMLELKSYQLDNNEGEIEIELATASGYPSKPETGNHKVKAQFRCKWSHNEQFLVRPCGVIISREMFFGSESVSQAPHLQAQGDHSLDNIEKLVDNFHFDCKHKAFDSFCVEHCDPRLFPELRGYHSMCREMAADKYEFFLDEMIMRKNVLIVASLKDKGNLPGQYPDVVYSGCSNV